MKNKLQPLIILLLILSLGFINSSHSAVFMVTTTAGTGAGSIDAAVTAANGNGMGKDTIYFNIPGAGPHTITMTAALQAINGNLLIDGAAMQTGYNPLVPKPVVELINTATTTFAVIGGSCEIRSLAFNSTNGNGIILNTSGNKVTGCYIGIGLDGVTDKGNSFQGIQMNNSSNSIIGGPTLAERNIISGNGEHGIQILSGSGNYIIGNYIGTNSSGTVAVKNNFNGIEIANTSNNNFIGGSSIDSSNLISGNGQSGIQIELNSNNIKIVGNNIGLQADRINILGNTQIGISLTSCSSIQIGGIGSSFANIISSNGGNGIQVDGCLNIGIKSNIIGTTLDTKTAKGNGGNGINIQNTNTNIIIGGDRLTEGNIISSSGGAGINVDPGTTGLAIKGNFIGTDNSGTINLGNNVIGIILKSSNTSVGGNANEGNVIGGTKIFSGILIADSDGHAILRNYIGVGLDGVSQLPNKTDGINISVENNLKSASNNIIQNNTIAYNTSNGINVGSALNNHVSTNELNNNLRFNSIYCNQQLGISLNLANTLDWGNTGKKAPAINNALSTTTKIVGLANGLPATDLIDIYEMSECISCDQNPQGKTYIATVSPDASGNWSYDNGSPITGSLIAMATDVNGNSSQFSLCFTPCSAVASITTSGGTNAMLETNKPITITLTSASTFSTLTTEPGKIFWSMGTPDTLAPALVSTNSALTLTFETAANTASYGPGLYDVYLIAKQSGCIDTTVIKLNLFFVPNLITPNGDLHNDRWEVGKSAGQFDAKIYNRWGDLVYFKSDYTNEWDGSNLSEGVYYYHLDDKVLKGKVYKGWVEIIK